MNIRTMEISFWRHKSKTKGKARLYCRITVAGERQEIGSTGLTIYHDHWDGERISEADPEAFFKNEQLDIMRNQLRATFNDLYRKKKRLRRLKSNEPFWASRRLLPYFRRLPYTYRIAGLIRNVTWQRAV